MKTFMYAVVGVTLLQGCTSYNSAMLETKDKAYAQFVTDENLAAKEKINGFKFNGWKPLSDNYLIMTAVHNKDYLIETKGRCVDLNKAHGIKLNRTSGLAVQPLADSISPVGVTSETCMIKSIYAISSIQSDQLSLIAKTVENQS
jgi:hypothetical protein